MIKKFTKNITFLFISSFIIKQSWNTIISYETLVELCKNRLLMHPLHNPPLWTLRYVMKQHINVSFMQRYSVKLGALAIRMCCVLVRHQSENVVFIYCTTYTVAGYWEEVQLRTKGKRYRFHISNININSNVLPKTVYNHIYAVTGQRAKMCP